MAVPADFAASMGAKSEPLRIRRIAAQYFSSYCGTVITVPYIDFS